MGLLMSRLYNFLFGPLEARLCLLGLDAAGKTTILYKLKLGERVTTIPTIGFNVETVEFQNLSITVWDVGGQYIIRPLWRHYFDNNDGIIFVIDSTDQIRFDEARDELISLLEDDRLRNSPLLVLANKQDLPNAATPAEITNMLGLTKMRSNRDWYVQRTSAVTGDGLVDGLTWLAGKIKSKKSNGLN